MSYARRQVLDAGVFPLLSPPPCDVLPFFLFFFIFFSREQQPLTRLARSSGGKGFRADKIRLILYFLDPKTQRERRQILMLLPPHRTTAKDERGSGYERLGAAGAPSVCLVVLVFEFATATTI